MSDPIKIRTSIKGSEGEVRVLMPHPMETGLRKDPSGRIPPAHFIIQVSLSLNGRSVIEGALGTSVSANPLFAFQLKDVKAGDRVAVSWLDNTGQKGAAEAVFGAG